MSSSISITAMKRGCGIAAEHKRLIRNVCRAVIAAELNGTPCVVDIHATDDAGIREINLDRRNVDKPTDVLSFPMFDLQPNEQPKPQLWELQDGRIFLGDIVISAERAAAQAREYGHSTERELAFLTAHAMLHLLGYDHERSKADETLHFSKQEAVLRELGVARYY